MKIIFDLLFGITLISAGLAVQNSGSSCPSPDTIHPCDCISYSNIIGLACKNITDDDDLTSVMTVMKTQIDSKSFSQFELNYAFVRYLPGDLFEGTSIKKIYISDSGILSLSDGEYAFKGLEDSLYLISVEKCTYINHWDWSQLKRLKNLAELLISESNMLEISEDFMDFISKWSLRDLYLRENNIKRIPPKAFSKLEKLRYLNLDQNSLNSLERSLFPKPAKYLEVLSFRENSIEHLPVDIFREMPSLTHLYLNGNPIMVLEEQSFEPVWKNLNMVTLGDTLHCDCWMSWMAWMPRKYKDSIDATCKTPPRLRGRNPADLKKEDFKC